MCEPAFGTSLSPLTSREKHILGLVVAGFSGKSIALELGLSESQISKALAASAVKLGLRNRAELVRHVATQGRSVGEPVPDALTAAERDVLELIVRGHSNVEIAAKRGRSPTTVANQVSALLRKTGVGSRRALMVAFCQGASHNQGAFRVDEQVARSGRAKLGVWPHGFPSFAGA